MSSICYRYVIDQKISTNSQFLNYFLGFLPNVDSFTVETKDGDDSYTYVFQLCGDAGGIPGAGVVQFDKKKPEAKPKVIGIYSATQAIGGSKLLQNKNSILNSNDYEKLLSAYETVL